MSPKAAVIGGTLFYKTPLFSKNKPLIKKTQYGEAEVIISSDAVFLPRHGATHKTPPHGINHCANMAALKELGVKYVIGACSVGSLKKEITPGTIIIPDDYISLWNIPAVFNEEVKHITPILSEKVRLALLINSENKELKIIPEGVYFQSTGPRLETKAEIRLFSSFADIVGMTMGSEATAAQEYGLEYAAICSVDNYANGVTDNPPCAEEIFRLAATNSEKVKDIVISSIEKLIS